MRPPRLDILSSYLWEVWLYFQYLFLNMVTVKQGIKGIKNNYYMALSHKDWELPNSWIWLAEIDIDLGEQGCRSGESARLPCNNVTRVRFPDPASYVDWICCWFSTLLWEVFLRVLRFSPLLKKQHFQIPIRSGMHGHFWMSSCELLGAPWVNKITKLHYIDHGLDFPI